uniref:Uncharacterized protein n=1 Tax=viral metagenome TaxID=1070528 RepID=A0A6C0D8C7_9ZZZZ
MDDIFDLIKSQNFDKLKKIILDQPNNTDFNIHDEYNNYLIHYILIYNQSDILNILLKRSIRLDILDIDGRTILHIPIKFNNVKMLETLLIYNKELIGISIIDIRDNLRLTALHYCIILNNIDCLKLLIENGADPMIRDNDGNNVLQLALEYERTDIILYFINLNINLNFLSLNNESFLQLAIAYKKIDIINMLLKKQINLNNQEKEYGLGALHQCVVLNMPPVITDNIIKNGCNINLQDYYGNTSLMYAIVDKLYDHIKVFINYSQLNYNLTNSKGETALHILLENYENYIDYPNIITTLIKNTDLNIQDNNGNTCLYLIFQNKILSNHDLLENKELNIFIKNNDNISTYDFIQNKPEYINIVINSFYNYLIINKDKLTLDWELVCANKKENEQKCKDKIKNIIIKEHRSIPKVTDYELILDNGIFVNTCYYTGSHIDILFGLLFLYDKFKNNNMGIIIDYPLTSNKQLEDYFKSLGINYNYKLDFCNFEINWSYQKMIMPTYFDEEIKSKIKNTDYIIIPIGIETNIGSHANILFYDVKKSIIERFEPNGANYPKDLNYNPKLLDQLLEIKFKKLDSDIKYKRPYEYLPIIGFQILENINYSKCKRIGDPNGFCGVWCIWWIYHKMKNLQIESKELAEKLIKEIKFKNINFKTLIRNFSKNITDLRDTFLKKYNIDINDFISYNYDKNILNNLEKDIIKYI